MKSAFVCVGLLILLFLSCSSKSRAFSVTASLDEADRYIAQGYPADALKVLRATEKKIISPMEAVGIYKRYARLDEKKRAEKVLQNALKKNPESLELNAVYSNFLKKAGRFSEALERAKILSGTRYGSVYAELYLKNAAESGENFLGGEFIQIFADAYSGTADNAWLRNAALLFLKDGRYAEAAALVPAEYKSSADAYFWALCNYDAAKYGEAALCIEDAKQLSARKTDSFADGIPERQKVSAIELSSLMSDAYVNMGEAAAAEEERSALIREITFGEEMSGAAENGTSESLLGTVYLNSALYALQNNDERAAYNALTFVVQKWPDYVPALIAYGNFAYNSSRRVMDDPLTKSLRDAGMVSSEMKRFESLPRVSVSDALLRMRESVARTHNDLLYVAELDLEDKIDTNSDSRARLGRMWRVLERNTLSADLYPPEITQYAVHTLLTLEEYAQAKDLFKKYITARYDLDAGRFEESLAASVEKMRLWEAEYSAFFAASERDADLSRRLYEYAVYENVECATQSEVNLAMIYSSGGNKEKALELYGRAQGHATDNFLRSEIMYRLACIQDASMDRSAALKSLEYGLYLNPGNNRARLLSAKLKN